MEVNATVSLQLISKGMARPLKTRKLWVRVRGEGDHVGRNVEATLNYWKILCFMSRFNTFPFSKSLIYLLIYFIGSLKIQACTWCVLVIFNSYYFQFFSEALSISPSQLQILFIFCLFGQVQLVLPIWKWVHGYT